MSGGTLFVCGHCDAQYPKWVGRCTECGQWGTVAASAAPAVPARKGRSTPAAAPVATTDLTARGTPAVRLPTGVDEVDRALGGGFVAGSSVLLGGEPGVGKSTLALQLARRFAKAGSATLYCTGEESLDQVGVRLDRLGGPLPGLRFAAETDAAAIAATIESMRPAFVVVDSVQTLRDPEVEGAAGSPSQVRAATGRITASARSVSACVLLVGQVVKSGGFAGPKAFEHAVDVVAMLEGDPTHAFRLLRATKNRFGGTDEVGVFELGAAGFVPVPDPSRLLLGTRSRAPGAIACPVVAGSRVFLVELQALTAPAGFGAPKRTAAGFDAKRLAVLLAVLERRAGIAVSAQDVYVNVAGGFTVTDPGADLALLLAVASAKLDRAVPHDVAAFGEVALSGAVRPVARPEVRAKEAKRLGFARILAPSAKRGGSGIATVVEALTAAGLR